MWSKPVPHHRNQTCTACCFQWDDRRHSARLQTCHMHILYVERVAGRLTSPALCLAPCLLVTHLFIHRISCAELFARICKRHACLDGLGHLFICVDLCRDQVHHLVQLVFGHDHHSIQIRNDNVTGSNDDAFFGFNSLVDGDDFDGFVRRCSANIPGKDLLLQCRSESALTGKSRSRCSCKSRMRPMTTVPTAPLACARVDIRPP